MDVLRADAKLQALVGDRIYDNAPGEQVLPYVALSRVSQVETEHRGTLTVVSDYRGSEEAKAVVAAIREAIDGRTFADVGDTKVTYADVFRASDYRTTFGVVRFRGVR